MAPANSSQGSTPLEDDSSTRIPTRQQLTSRSRQPVAQELASQDLNAQLESTPSQPSSLSVEAANSKSANASNSISATIPPTPSTAIPQTPQNSMAPPAERLKKTKLELDSNQFQNLELVLLRPPDEFTLFPKLPLEMRRKIWQAALSDPQVIEFDPSGWHKSTWRQPNPTILCVSKESRTEALRIIRLAFHVGPRAVYINPAIDTLLVSELFIYGVKALVSSWTTSCLRRLAVNDIGPWRRFFRATTQIPLPVLVSRFRTFLPFQNLDQLAFVWHSNGGSESGSTATLYDLLSVPVPAWPPAPLREFDYVALFSPEAHQRHSEEFCRDTGSIQKQYDDAMRALTALSKENPGWKVPEVVFMGMERG